ncbi:hypothetical protein HKD37_08G022746 [Glycine soja]
MPTPSHSHSSLPISKRQQQQSCGCHKAESNRGEGLGGGDGLCFFEFLSHGSINKESERERNFWSLIALGVGALRVVVRVGAGALLQLGVEVLSKLAGVGEIPP